MGIMSREYTVGLVFRNFGKEVALIKKTHPEWQSGRLNGIGGRIEDGETPFETMCREFREETGATVAGWGKFCELRHQDRTIHYFVTHGGYALSSTTDEIVSWYKVRDISTLPVIQNLLWLIPLALDKDNVTAVVADRSEVAACLCNGFYKHPDCPMHRPFAQQ